MTLTGHVENNRIVLDGNETLPDDLRVTVSIDLNGDNISLLDSHQEVEKYHRIVREVEERRVRIANMERGIPPPEISFPGQPHWRVEFPLVKSDRPGTVHLTAEQTHELLNDDDLSAGH